MAADGPEIRRLAEQGKTVVFVLLDGAPVAAIALAAWSGRNSRRHRGLKAMPIRCVMLTGPSGETTPMLTYSV
jgi:Cu2+-exporting ATPase